LLQSFREEVVSAAKFGFSEMGFVRVQSISVGDDAVSEQPKASSLNQQFVFSVVKTGANAGHSQVVKFPWFPWGQQWRFPNEGDDIFAWRSVWNFLFQRYPILINDDMQNLCWSPSNILEMERKNINFFFAYRKCDPRAFRMNHRLSIEQGSLGGVFRSFRLSANEGQAPKGEYGSSDSDDEQCPVRPRWWTKPVAEIVRFGIGTPLFYLGGWLISLTGYGWRWRWRGLWNATGMLILVIGMACLVDPMGW